MWAISYWVFPAFSSFVWLAMLLAMLLTWAVDWHSPHLASMAPTQSIAYISDVGATSLKPLFIAMGTTSVVTFTAGFLFERWLRHLGKLAHNTSTSQKVLSILATLAAVAGAVGLILLSIFDTLHHKHLHDGFLVLFIAGYVLSAVFICAEYQRLGIHYREFRVLRLSFWVKLAFIFIEVALAIGFGVENLHKHYNTAAVLEWVIALVFFFYVFSFFIDFVPAWQDPSRGRHGRSGPPMEEVAERVASGEPLATDGTVDRYGYINGAVSGGLAGERYYENGAGRAKPSNPTGAF